MRRLEWLKKWRSGDAVGEIYKPCRRAMSRYRTEENHEKPPRQALLLRRRGCSRACPRACGRADGVAGPGGCAGAHCPGADVRGRPALAEAAGESLAARGDHRGL